MIQTRARSIAKMIRHLCFVDRFLRPAIAFLMLCLLWQDASDGLQTNPAQAGSVDWKAGEDWKKKLSTAVSVTFSGVPLRENLTKFSQHEGIGLFIDRRVDPSISISMNETNLTFEQALWKLAAKNNLGVCQLGEIYYLGPSDVAKVLPVLWHEMELETDQLGRQKTKWSKKFAVDWPMLSQPDQILKGIAGIHQIKIRSRLNGSTTNATNLIPHDVWPEIRLPAISLDEQFALLLVGFGLWFDRSKDGLEIQIIDFPARQEGRMAFQGLSDAKKSLPQLRKQFPNSKFFLAREVLSAEGTIAELSEIGNWLVSNRQPEKGTAQSYSLKTHATRKQILATISHRIGRKLEFPEEMARTMDERIEFSVVNVSVEELIRKVLEGTDLSFDLNEERLSIQR